MNNNNTQQNIEHDTDLRQKVLAKIQTGELVMRSRRYFLAKLILLGFVAFLILVTSVLLVSYIAFSVHESGQYSLLTFGLRGIYVFFLLFPWFVLLLDVLLLVLLDWLLKQFSFGYHSPFVYLLLGSSGLIFTVAYIVFTTPLHPMLMHRADEQHLPVFGGLYEGVRTPHHDRGVFRGVVTEIEQNDFIMEDEKSNSIEPSILEKVLVPQGLRLSNLFKIGDHVFVAGDMVGAGEIQAYGISNLSMGR